MLPSNSAASLTSRLIPQQGVSLNQNGSSVQGGLSTLKPKMLGSKSTPSLQLAKGSSPNENGKTAKVRPDTTKRHGLALSNSRSAAILSPDPSLHLASESEMGGVGSKPSTSNSYRGPQEGTLVSRVDMNKTRLSSEADYGEKLTMEDTDGVSFQQNSFIGSLGLTTQQLYDLFKVPHTFFYLRSRTDAAAPPRPYTAVTGALPAAPGPASGNGIEGEGVAGTFAPPHAQVTPRAGFGSVYDLELVGLDQVDKNDYFTLSKEGVTQFRNKVSQFTILHQWEREYQLFHRIANINFFKVYKRWKVKSHI